MRTRDEVRGSRSPESAEVGAVAFRLVLMSCFLGLPDHAPLALCGLGSSVRVVRYGRGLRAIKKVAAKSLRNHDAFAFASLRVGGATALVAKRDSSERVINLEEKWRSDTYQAQAE